MEFAITPDQERLRAEVRAFLAEALPRGWGALTTRTADEIIARAARSLPTSSARHPARERRARV